LGGRATIWGLGDGPGDYHPEREQVLLVHGLQGAPSDLQPVCDRLRGGPFQLHVVAYNSYRERTSINGDELADELATLRPMNGGRLTIVAHSMGGIVARQAVNHLVAGARPALRWYRRLRLLAIDTPWHGY